MAGREGWRGRESESEKGRVERIEKEEGIEKERKGTRAYMNLHI